jgi:hypothetical protein
MKVLSLERADEEEQGDEGVIPIQNSRIHKVRH